VIDADRRAVGVVSEADLLDKVEFLGLALQRRIFARQSRAVRVDDQQAAVAADLMMTPAITVRPDKP
jgi:hypothetical protein